MWPGQPEGEEPRAWRSRFADDRSRHVAGHGNIRAFHGGTCESSHRQGRSDLGAAPAHGEVSGAEVHARGDAECRRRPDISRDVVGEFGAGLFEGVRAHRSGDLLTACLGYMRRSVLTPVEFAFVCFAVLN